MILYPDRGKLKQMPGLGVNLPGTFHYLEVKNAVVARR